MEQWRRGWLNATMIRITERLSIHEEELKFTASRSSGPGGQYVNKVNTRVTLHFDVIHSPALSYDQRQRVLSRLRTRINKEGVLRVVSQRHRSQSANRSAVIERFVELMREALRSTPPRKKTRSPVAARQRRVNEKRRRGHLKRLRSKGDLWDD